MNKKITSRIDLNIGMKCNIKCRFCYYFDKTDEPFKDYDDLLGVLKKYRKCGIDKLHITGGEPTIYKSLFKLARTAKQLGFIDIGIITNGILLRNREFVVECKTAGIDHFNISLHGHNAVVHDELTQSKESFDMIMRGIANLKELNYSFSINSVVNHNNYRFLKDFSELMIKLKPKEIALLYFNPMDCASSSMNNMSVKYSETIPYLNECIDLLEKNNIRVSFKFLPYCVIGNSHEKNLANLPQALYEEWEWNYRTRYISYIGRKKFLTGLIKNFKKFTKEQIKELPFSVLSYLYAVFSSESYFYKKLAVCNNCKYDLVCQGVNKHYLEMHGDTEFISAKGNKVIRPDLFLNPQNMIKASLSDKTKNKFFLALSRLFFK